MIILQHYSGMMPHMYTQCINQLRSMMPDLEYKFFIEPVIEHRRYSINVKLDLLLKNSDGFWLDPDFLMLKPFDFEFKKDRPYIYGKRCSASAIFANGHLDVIKLIRDSIVGTECAHRFIDAHRELFNIIPDGYLQHLSLGAMRNSGLQVKKNDQCQISKKEDGEYKFDWIKNFKIINNQIYKEDVCVVQN